MNNITLKQIKAFLAIARLGSFTRAAIALHSTQSSLSILIKELESELGIRVMDRTTRKIELTDAGREFLLSAERIVGELDQAITGTRDLTTLRKGRVTIATPLLFAAAFLPHVIAEYHSRHPEISINLQDLRADQVVARVADGRVDCGVGVFDQEEGFSRVPLMSENLALVCPRDHALSRKSQVEWKDLAPYPFIRIRDDKDENITRRHQLEQRLNDAGIELQPSIEVRNMTTVLGLVGANMGIAIWPAWASSLLRAYDVEMRPLINPNVSHMISLITPLERSLSPAALSFVDVLRDHARSYDASSGALKSASGYTFNSTAAFASAPG